MSAIGEELTRLRTVGEHHRRLAARLTLVVGATLVLDLLAGVVMYFAERHAPGTQIHTIGQALFFVTTQLLTVSSSMRPCGMSRQTWTSRLRCPSGQVRAGGLSRSPSDLTTQKGNPVGLAMTCQCPCRSPSVAP